MGSVKTMIEHLKDPALVARVQAYYGVERVVLLKSSTEFSKSPVKANGVGSTIHRRKAQEENHQSQQDCLAPNEEDSDTEDTFSSDVDAETCGYKINNKFWFYLFTLGTALGDELFYATFIPFWFWNVDGAVGRRMVLVWCINMYIGKPLALINAWIPIFFSCSIPLIFVIRTRYQGFSVLASSWISCYTSAKKMGTGIRNAIHSCHGSSINSIFSPAVHYGQISGEENFYFPNNL